MKIVTTITLFMAWWLIGLPLALDYKSHIINGVALVVSAISVLLTPIFLINGR